MKMLKKKNEVPEKKWPTIRSMLFKRYSEGYTFYQIEKEGGKPGRKTISVYTGDYYFLPEAAPSRVRLRHPFHPFQHCPVHGSAPASRNLSVYLYADRAFLLYHCAEADDAL